MVYYVTIAKEHLTDVKIFASPSFHFVTRIY